MNAAPAGPPAGPPAPPPPPPPRRTVRVAVWGCGHGELDTVYAALAAVNARAADGRAVELLLCCGDFQAVRNAGDLEAMACPPKYRALRTFHRYYSGERAAPVLTLFVGGNHEASNHLRELHLGGWVAPRIYYLGSSGVVRVRGLRVGRRRCAALRGAGRLRAQRRRPAAPAAAPTRGRLARARGAHGAPARHRNPAAGSPRQPASATFVQVQCRPYLTPGARCDIASQAGRGHGL
jgi:hypothetical protein